MPIALDPPAAVSVEVHNVRNDHGLVVVALCPKARFLADSCPYQAQAKAQTGTTRVVVEHVPPGEYAAQAFHDENSNGDIDRGIFGIPKEGVGFSRDAPFVPSSPHWQDAVFTHTAAPQVIGFRLRYLTGPSSPEAWQRRHGQ
jgi:uncharacterized protein (DUF2141 family)